MPVEKNLLERRAGLAHPAQKEKQKFEILFARPFKAETGEERLGQGAFIMFAVGFQRLGQIVRVRHQRQRRALR